MLRRAEAHVHAQLVHLGPRAVAVVGGRAPGDVAVQLFSVELLGIEFGLKKTGDEHVEYIPLLLGFDPPWNGFYNT